MILDKQNMFSEAQDLAQAAGNYLSTNTIDLGSPGSPVVGGIVSDVGRGMPLEVICQITETFTSGGAATVQAQLVMADNAALSSNLTILDETPAIALATLIAGYQFRLRAIPQGITKRYLGMRYVIGTATTTAGEITSGLALSRMSAGAV